MPIEKQARVWMGEFGDEYLKRNLKTTGEADKMAMDLWGVSRTEMNQEFLGGLDRNIRILEVGSNTGNMLMLLHEIGFKNLYGAEINEAAIAKARQISPQANIVYGEGTDIPFKDGYFDLVFTSVALIHIHPETLKKVSDEMYRCTRQYIWGFEYYNDTFTEVKYRGNDELMWKGDYASFFKNRFPGMELVKEKRYKYLQDNNVDTMYLLRKK